MCSESTETVTATHSIADSEVTIVELENTCCSISTQTDEIVASCCSISTQTDEIVASCCSISTQTDLTGEYVEKCQEAAKTVISKESLINDNQKLKFYTGMLK